MKSHEIKYDGSIGEMAAYGQRAASLPADVMSLQYSLWRIEVCEKGA